MECKPIELQRVATPLNKIDLSKVENEVFPYFRRKTDNKIFSNSVKTEDIITREEVEKLKEDLKRKEETAKRKLEALRKEFLSYQAEMEVDSLLKENKIKDLESRIAELNRIIANKEHTIALQKGLIEKQKQIIYEQTTEYMKDKKASEEEKDKINKEYSKTIARIVHDMKNPLTGIKSGLEVLLEDDTIENRREILNMIYLSAKDLSAMIEEILLNNKLVHNAVELNKREYCLSDQIRSIYELSKLSAERKNKKINVDCQGNVFIYADESKIRRAIENIVLNAIKYCNSTVKIKLSADSENAYIVVSDDGNGFNEEVRKKVISNRDMATTDLINGNGFGLTNAKRLIEMHSGALMIRNLDGNGSEITIKLPRRRE